MRGWALLTLKPFGLLKAVMVGLQAGLAPLRLYFIRRFYNPEGMTLLYQAL